MNHGLTDYEIEVLRAYSRSAVAPLWKRFLWGRDVYHPALRTWRRLMVVYFVAAFGAVIAGALLPPRATITGALFVAMLAAHVSAMIVRWHSLRPR